MDRNTFEIESRKIWQIENAQAYEAEAKRRQQEVKEKAKVK